MPATTTACPSCQRQVRVPESVLGKRVQCPVCQNTFVAPAATVAVGEAVPAAPAPAPLPPAPVPAAAMQLTIEDEGPARRTLKVPPPPAPLQPVVLDAVRDESAPAMRSCPYCAERIPSQAAHCRFCGEDLKDDRPEWERPGAIRRDCESHRGGTVLVIGIIGVPLSLTAWMMARSDLRKMEAGEMDPQGMNNTRGGRICGIIGTVVGCLWFGVFAFAIMAIIFG